MAEKDTSPDADLQLKKRARRRLVGAAALALFAVIVLPMVMDREPRSMTQDIQVRIPSQDSTGLAARVMPGKPVATPMPAPEPKAVAEAPVLAEKPNPEPAVAKPGVPATVPAGTQAPAAAPTQKPATHEKKAAVADTPSPKPVAEPKPADEASGQWVVQLGAYKEAGNVKLLLAKLKGVNVPAYTEKFESPQGPRTRVRAGPFATQEAAEKARSRIKIIGVDGSVAARNQSQ